MNRFPVPYRNLSGEIGVDAVVVTPEAVERYRDTHCLVICPALKKEGASMIRKRLPPDDPQEWLLRAKSDLALMIFQGFFRL